MAMTALADDDDDNDDNDCLPPPLSQDLFDVNNGDPTVAANAVPFLEGSRYIRNERPLCFILENVAGCQMAAKGVSSDAVYKVPYP